MRWNPILQKWEGNEEVLRDFDPPPPPLRPALITNFGASSRTPQTVGNMVWDPISMSWRGNEDDGLVFDGFDEDDDNHSMISVATGLTGKSVPPKPAPIVHQRLFGPRFRHRWNANIRDFVRHEARFHERRTRARHLNEPLVSSEARPCAFPRFATTRHPTPFSGDKAAGPQRLVVATIAQRNIVRGIVMLFMAS